MRWKLAALVLLVANCAQAQVFRCPDRATGKVTYSDAPCSDGKQILRKRTAEDQLLDLEQAAAARQRFERDQEIETTRQQRAAVQPPKAASPKGASISHECSVAQKNAWGVNKDQNQRKADIICYGSEQAAKLQVARDERATAEAAEGEARHRAKVRTSPTSFTSCSKGFCYDNTGGVYHRNGNFMTGPNGRTCHRAGNIWNCN